MAGPERNQDGSDAGGEPVLVFSRISRERQNAAGDSVRIYRTSLGYYIVWGDTDALDLGSMEPVEDADASLDAAMGWDDEFFVVRPDTVEVYGQMDRPELIERLKPKGAFLHEAIEVNGEPWTPGPTIDALVQHADMAFVHSWEGGMGEYGRYVYTLEGAYYAYDRFDAENEEDPFPAGPYSSIRDAILGCGFHHVSSASSRIRSDMLSRDELIALLKADASYRGDIPVNGEVWEGPTQS